ncbi:MAG: 3-deoxy-manno-octulosonate cytidylyltransferase [Acidobacteria bacterium]|nr:MAG: 3-deoxy-manno-octulosonate cytidylyltransferase [Acidobacteriota bacterium]
MHPVGFRDPFDRTLPPPQVVAVIPARYDATRLPGKPLAEIAGKPMIEHVYRRAAAARGVDAVVVATDDMRIEAAVKTFGGIAMMTRPTHRTGTDRIAEVAANLSCEIVLNVQGDEPLLEPETLEAVIEPLLADPMLEMSTVCFPISNRADYDDPNVVKVVKDKRGHALYFSRSPIPNRRTANLEPPIYKHLGLYGFRRTFLLKFATLPQTPLEKAESLEQLRALEHGYRIHTVETKHDSIGVDTPEDLERVRVRLKADTTDAVVSGFSRTTR